MEKHYGTTVTPNRAVDTDNGHGMDSLNDMDDIFAHLNIINLVNIIS